MAREDERGSSYPSQRDLVVVSIERSGQALKIMAPMASRDEPRCAVRRGEVRECDDRRRDGCRSVVELRWIIGVELLATERRLWASVLDLISAKTGTENVFDDPRKAAPPHDLIDDLAPVIEFAEAQGPRCDLVSGSLLGRWQTQKAIAYLANTHDFTRGEQLRQHTPTSLVVVDTMVLSWWVRHGKREYRSRIRRRSDFRLNYGRPMVDISIANSGDIGALVELESRLFAEDAGVHDPNADVTWPSREGVADFEQLLGDDDSVVFIAREDGKPAGFTAGYASKSGATRQPLTMGVLRSMYVHDDARGAGTGQRLTVAFIDWARGKGCAEVHVESYFNNGPARRLYERSGFSPQSVSHVMYL